MTALPTDERRVGYYPKAERDRLLARIDELEAELAYLRGGRQDYDPDKLALICHRGFTQGQGRLLLALFDSPQATGNLPLARRAGVGTMWSRHHDRDEETIIGALKCQIHWTRVRWRTAVADYDPIATIYRVGYALTPEARAWLAGVVLAGPLPAGQETAPTPSQSPANGNLKRGGSP